MNNVEKRIESRHEYYIKNRERIREICRKSYYKNHEKQLVRNKNYREKNKDKIRKYYRDWYAKNGRKRAGNYIEAILEWMQMFPERMRAMQKLHYAIFKGDIIRPNICERCKRVGKVHGHHANYEKSMEVEWLCASCHKLEHSPIDKIF